MARLWSCGFELQSVTSGMEMDTFSGGGNSISTTTFRSGLASLRRNPSAQSSYAQHLFTNSVSEVYARVYVNFATLPSATEDIFGLLENDFGGWTSFGVGSDGSLYYYDGNTVAYVDTTQDLSTGVWYRLEIYFETVGTTWHVTYRLDGSQVGDYDWTGTPGTSNSLLINFGTVAAPWTGGSGTASYDCFYDDAAVNDTSGGSQTSWPGSGKIVHMKPNAAGDAAATAGDYTAIDEVTPNDVTDFIEIDTDSGGQQANYNFETSSDAGIGSSDTITLVHVGVRHRAETAASMSYTPQIKSQSGGTTVDGTATTHNDTTWRTNGDAQPRNYKLTSYTDPQAGGAWTPSLLDTMIAGVNVTDGNPDVHISTIWVLVEYIPVSLAAIITGTLVPSVLESDIVTGGKTSIITLTGDTWVTSGATFDGQRQNIINGHNSAQSEGAGWNAEVRDKQGVSGVVRTSDTVVTVTLDAQASYNITATETITVTVPATALSGGATLVATPTFQVSPTIIGGPNRVYMTTMKGFWGS